MKGKNLLTVILTTTVFVVVLVITILDFLDNGKIDNDKFLLVALFVFSGAGAGRALDALVDKYIGPVPPEETKKEN